MAIDYSNIKIHWTHVIDIKKLYKEGYTNVELAIMYKVPIYKITNFTRGLKQPERV